MGNAVMDCVDSWYDFKINQRVAIIGGSYKRYGHGKVVGQTKCKVMVDVDGLGKTRNLMKTSVKAMTIEENPNKHQDTVEKLTEEIELLRLEIQRLRIAIQSSGVPSK